MSGVVKLDIDVSPEVLHVARVIENDDELRKKSDLLADAVSGQTDSQLSECASKSSVSSGGRLCSCNAEAEKSPKPTLREPKLLHASLDIAEKIKDGINQLDESIIVAKEQALEILEVYGKLLVINFLLVFLLCLAWDEWLPCLISGGALVMHAPFIVMRLDGCFPSVTTSRTIETATLKTIIAVAFPLTCASVFAAVNLVGVTVILIIHLLGSYAQEGAPFIPPMMPLMLFDFVVGCFHLTVMELSYERFRILEGLTMMRRCDV